MSDVTCSDCGKVMDQSDVCSHACPENLKDRVERLEREVIDLREQLSNCLRRIGWTS